jgi:hypothetical protein
MQLKLFVRGEVAILLENARVVELVDTLALEASAQKAWGFKSLREHHSPRDLTKIRTRFRSKKGTFIMKNSFSILFALA